MSYSHLGANKRRCETCSHAKVQLDDKMEDVDFDKSLFCMLKNKEVDDDFLCEKYKQTKDIELMFSEASNFA